MGKELQWSMKGYLESMDILGKPKCDVEHPRLFSEIRKKIQNFLIKHAVWKKFFGAFWMALLANICRAGWKKINLGS